MKASLVKKFGAWALFAAFILVPAGLSRTSYGREADTAYICLAFTFIMIVSVLVVRDRWRNRDKPSSPILRAVLRWCGGKTK
jgi:hypothetical protein